MTEDEAAKLRDDARAKLRSAGDEHKAVRATLHSIRDALQPLVLDALRAGVGVVEAAELSGYTRESVRRLARDNDIPPAER